MKALRWDGERATLDTRAATPTPGDGEALVRPLLMGISAIDVAIAAGRWRDPVGAPPFRGVLGHEFVGVVERVGGDAPVQAGLVGARVVGGGAIVCGRCDMCRAGLSNHCRDRRELGVRGRDGCFAELFTIPVRNLAPVPPGVPDDAAVFAEPLAAAAHAAQQIRVEGKPYITVLGDGPLALLTVQVMARLNASVRLVGRRARKLELCDRWGVKHRPEGDVGRRADQDVVVDCTGTSEGLALAMRLVRPRGKIVLKSLAHTGDGVDLAPLVEHEIDLIGSRTGAVAEAMALLAAGSVDTTGLVTRRAKLADGAQALRAAADPDQIKVVLEP